ncbi:PREDICTED: galectin-3-binding protein A-like, partial [Amphimedon queenslandica]
MSPVLLLVLTCLSVLSVISLSADALLYANGDVRLNRNGSVSIDNTLGVLEVYINDEWGTVCSDGFSTGSAAAVCRQLGYLDSQSYGLPSKY